MTWWKGLIAYVVTMFFAEGLWAGYVEHEDLIPPNESLISWALTTDYGLRVLMFFSALYWGGFVAHKVLFADPAREDLDKELRRTQARLEVLRERQTVG